MLSKQLTTFQQKTEKGSEIIAIYEQRCEHKENLISILDEELKNDLPKKQRLELEIQRLDIMESLIENMVSLKIKKEIQAEDARALDRFKAEHALYDKEINEGLFETGLESIKFFVRDTIHKNKKADVGRLQGLIMEAEKELNYDEKIDVYKQIKQVVGKLPVKMGVAK